MTASTTVVESSRPGDEAAVTGLITPRVRRQHQRPLVLTISIRGLSVLGVFVAWWLIARHVANPSKLPTPLEVYHNYGYLFSHEDLWGNLGDSLQRSLKGLIIGGSIGFALGALSGLTALGEESVDIPMQLLRFTPFLALIPLFITWFGLGEKPKIILLSIACATPIYLNTANAMRHVDRKTLEASRSFGLSGLRLIREVTLPLSLPGILTGLRFSMAISVLGLVAAEQINANSGIGAMLFNASGNFDTPTVFCCVVVYMLIGVCFDLIVALISALALRWRAGVAAR